MDDPKSFSSSPLKKIKPHSYASTEGTKEELSISPSSSSAFSLAAIRSSSQTSTVTSSSTTEVKEAPSPLQQALERHYAAQDKLPPNIDRRRLPIVEVQLSLVESVREKSRRSDTKKEVNDEKDSSADKGTAKKETHSKNSDKLKTPSLLEREENDSLRYYEDWHNVKEETITVDKMFGEGIKKSTRVLVLGPAGIGKTTLSQFIAHKWSKGDLWPQVEYVFWLPLRKLADDKYNDSNARLAHVICKNCLNPDDQKSVEVVKEIENVLSLAPSKVLMVLDGFDELASHLGTEEKPTHIKELFDEACRMGQVVLTSRPYQLAPELLSRFPRQLENRGFNNEQIETYVTHYFGTLKAPRPDLAKSLLQWLKENSSLSGMSHVPISLSLVCALLYEEDQQKEIEGKKSIEVLPSNMNLSSLYQQMVDSLLKRYLKEKKGLNIRGKDIAWVRGQCKGELYFLSYLAYRGLKEKKNPNLIGRWIDTTLAEWKKFYDHNTLSFDDILSLGFLPTSKDEHIADKDLDKENDLDKTLCFLHLSFQEYFTAVHIIECLRVGKGYQPHHEVSTFISTEKYNPRYAMVFIFAAGLAHIESKEFLTKELWTLFLAPPIDMTGLGHLWLVLRCLDQANFDARIPHIRELEQQLQERFATIVERCLQKYEEGTEHLFTRNWVHHLSAKTSKVVDPTLNKLLTTTQQEKSRTESHEKYINKKIRALRLLGNLKELAAHKDVFPTLLQQLSDSNTDIRRTAAETIGNMGEKAAREDAIAALFERLDDDDSDVTSAAVRALSKIGEKTTHESISYILLSLKRLRGDGKHARRVRCMAVEALGNMREKAAHEEVITTLLTLFEEDNSGVRSAAARALGNMGEKAAREDILNALTKALSNRDSHVMRAAAIALGNIGDTDACEHTLNALLKLLDDSDWTVRRAAAEALNMGEKAAREDVLSALFERLDDDDPGVTSAAVRALGNMGEKAARQDILNALFKLLNDNNSHVTVTSAAAEALGNMGEKAARQDILKALFKRLDDKNSDVTNAAVEALGNMGEKADRQKILNVLFGRLILFDTARHKRKDVYRAAILAITRRTALDGLKHMGEKAAREDIITALTEMLRDSESSTKNVAAEVLGNMGEKAAREDVLNALTRALSNRNSDIRSAAATALTRIPLPKTLENCKNKTTYSWSDWWTNLPGTFAIMSLLQGIPVVMRKQKNSTSTEFVLYTARGTEAIEFSSPQWAQYLSSAFNESGKTRGLPYLSCVSIQEAQDLQRYLELPTTALKSAPKLDLPEPPQTHSISTVHSIDITASATPHGANPHILMPQPRSAPASATAADTPAPQFTS